MDTITRIQAEIATLSEAELDELYRVVKSLVETRAENRKPGLLRRLSRIQIDAPEDFAANLERYVGEGGPSGG